jgi:hypothetical protein
VEHRPDAVNGEKIMVQKAIKLEAVVNAEGKLEFGVPLPPGTPVEVLVLAPEDDTFEDLLQAANSSTDFWDNALDDEDWNDA